MQLMANPWAELCKHWNGVFHPEGTTHGSAGGRSPAGAVALMALPDWRAGPDGTGGHVAGVWTERPAWGGAGGKDKEGEKEKEAKGPKIDRDAMPLLVELATDCNVADTWYEAK